MAVGSVVLVGGSVAASSLVADYPVLGGQAVRYLVAGLVLAVWGRLRHLRLARPTGREWVWLAGLALLGFAGCSVFMIEATATNDPASVGVVIGAAPLVIVIVGAIVDRLRPTWRMIAAAALVATGSAAAQLGGGQEPSFSPLGLALSLGALAGVVASTLLAAPLLPGLGALAVTSYACVLAGAALLVTAGLISLADGGPVLRVPTGVELASLAFLSIVVTAVVFIAWYGAMERLGTARTGLFNGLIPVTSLGAVALVGTGILTPLRALAALAVLAGVFLGLKVNARQGPKPWRSQSAPLSDVRGPSRAAESSAISSCAAATSSLLVWAWPCRPHPPSAASVRSTHVRSARVGSPAASATSRVSSATTASCLSRSRAPALVSTCTRTCASLPPRRPSCQRGSRARILQCSAETSECPGPARFSSPPRRPPVRVRADPQTCPRWQ